MVAFVAMVASAAVSRTSGLGLADIGTLTIKLFNSSTLDPTDQHTLDILWQIRLPRLCAAAMCGIALAVAGVIVQGVFRNPLGSPSLLGIESGGALAAVLVFYLGFGKLSLWTVPIAALIGAGVTMAIILTLARKNPSWPIEHFVLTGFALNAIQLALTSLLVALVLEQHAQGTAVLQWMFGTLQSRGWEHVLLGLPLLIIGIFMSIRLANRLDTLSLGEEVTTSLGIDVQKLRQQAIVAAALLVGSAISIAGTIPFVSLVVPHLTRSIQGPSHRKLLIGAALNGVTVLVLADLIARTIRHPAELELGIVTTLVGTPLFLWMLIGRRRGRSA